MTTKTKKAAKPAAKKTPAKPAAAPATGDARKLTNWQQPNPKKAGSASAARYDAYAGSSTVAEFLAAGGTVADLRWDEAHNFVKVEG